MNTFPQYAERPAPPVQLESYLDPMTTPRRPSRIRRIARRAVLIPLGVAGTVGLGAWGAWAGFGALMEPGRAADAAPVVSVRPPAAQPGVPVHERSPKVPDTVTEDGVYIVGKQIKTGTYRATCGAKITCVWQRYQVLGGVTTAVASGTALPGQTVLVELGRTDFAFGVLGFGSWTLQ